MSEETNVSVRYRAESQRVGKALLEYRDNPPCNEEGGTLCGQWYVPGDVMAIIMEPETIFTTADYLTRLAHLMGVDDGTNAELKPCPFCGGEAHVVSDYSSERDETRWNLWHECEGFVGKSNGYGYSLHPWFETPWYGTREEAVAAWNRRAQKGV